MRRLLLYGAVLALAVGGNFSAAQANFILTFDEAGNGSYTQNAGPVVNDPGFILDGFLTYGLPEIVGPGDVGMAYVYSQSVQVTLGLPNACQ
jgi:hypothetical protein